MPKLFPREVREVGEDFVRVARGSAPVVTIEQTGKPRVRAVGIARASHFCLPADYARMSSSIAIPCCLKRLDSVLNRPRFRAVSCWWKEAFYPAMRSVELALAQR